MKCYIFHSRDILPQDKKKFNNTAFLFILEMMYSISFLQFNVCLTKCSWYSYQLSQTAGKPQTPSSICFRVFAFLNVSITPPGNSAEFTFNCTFRFVVCCKWLQSRYYLKSEQNRSWFHFSPLFPIKDI